MPLRNRREFLRLSAATATLPLLVSRANAATEHTVLIKNFSFEPAEIAISAGDSIVFTNEDGAPHTATDDNGAFDTGRLNRDQSATLTFPSAGNFAYHCAFHPRMTGTITIS